ncbi:hypothetical protein L7F22_033850 [Adiantum nelumboides]|nr:hypothetical protein [Adiantum nelumboides]
MHTTLGYVFMLVSGAISWQTKRQTSVACSTTEAKYIAAALASREALWLSHLLHELRLPFSLSQAPLTLYADNQSAISLAQAPALNAKTKHIAISYHFLKELVEGGFLKLVYVCTHENWADMITKGTTAGQLDACCNGAGLLCSP